MYDLPGELLCVGFRSSWQGLENKWNQKYDVSNFMLAKTENIRNDFPSFWRIFYSFHDHDLIHELITHFKMKFLKPNFTRKKVISLIAIFFKTEIVIVSHFWTQKNKNHDLQLTSQIDRPCEWINKNLNGRNLAFSGGNLTRGNFNFQKGKMDGHRCMINFKSEIVFMH